MMLQDKRHILIFVFLIFKTRASWCRLLSEPLQELQENGLREDAAAWPTEQMHISTGFGIGQRFIADDGFEEIPADWLVTQAWLYQPNTNLSFIPAYYQVSRNGFLRMTNAAVISPCQCLRAYVAAYFPGTRFNVSRSGVGPEGTSVMLDVLTGLPADPSSNTAVNMTLGPDATWIMVDSYLPPAQLTAETEVRITSVNYTCDPSYGDNVTAVATPIATPLFNRVWELLPKVTLYTPFKISLSMLSYVELDAPNPWYGSIAGPFPRAGVTLANNTGPYTIKAGSQHPLIDFSSRTAVWWLESGVGLTIQNITLMNLCVGRFGDSGSSRLQHVHDTIPLRPPVVVPDQLLPPGTAVSGQVLAAAAPMLAARHITAPTASRVVIDSATVVVGRREVANLQYLAALTCGWWAQALCIPNAMSDSWAQVPDATAPWPVPAGTAAGGGNALVLRNLAAVKLAALSFGKDEVRDVVLAPSPEVPTAQLVSQLVSDLEAQAPRMCSLAPHAMFVNRWQEMPITGHRMKYTILTAVDTPQDTQSQPQLPTWLTVSSQAQPQWAKECNPGGSTSATRNFTLEGDLSANVNSSEQEKGLRSSQAWAPPLSVLHGTAWAARGSSGQDIRTVVEVLRTLAGWWGEANSTVAPGAIVDGLLPPAALIFTQEEVRFIPGEQGVLDDAPEGSAPERVVVLSQPALLAGPVPIIHPIPSPAKSVDPLPWDPRLPRGLDSGADDSDDTAAIDSDKEDDTAIDKEVDLPDMAMPPSPLEVPLINLALSVWSVQLAPHDTTRVTGNSSLAMAGTPSFPDFSGLASAGVLHMHRLALKNLPNVAATSSWVPHALRTPAALSLPLWTFAFPRPATAPAVHAEVDLSDTSQGLAEAGVQLVLKDVTVQLPQQEFAALLVLVRLGADGAQLAARARQVASSVQKGDASVRALLDALSHPVLAGVWELQGVVPSANTSLDAGAGGNSTATSLACGRSDAEGEAGLQGQCILTAMYSGWGALGQRVQFVPSEPLDTHAFQDLTSFSVALLRTAVQPINESSDDHDHDSDSSSGSGGGSSSMGLAIGIGVGVGGACVLAAVVAGVWYRRASSPTQDQGSTHSLAGPSKSILVGSKAGNKYLADQTPSSTPLSRSCHGNHLTEPWCAEGAASDAASASQRLAINMLSITCQAASVAPASGATGESGKWSDSSVSRRAILGTATSSKDKAKPVSGTSATSILSSHAHSVRAELASVMDEVVEAGHSALELTEYLGQGAFGVVFKGTWHGLEVAVKRLLMQHVSGPEGDRSRQAAMKEAAIAMSLHHPNIITTYSHEMQPLHDAGAAATPQASKGVEDWHLYLVQEYCDGGSLLDVFRKHRFWSAPAQASDKGPLAPASLEAAARPPTTHPTDVSHVLCVAINIGSGMAYLHSRSILHGDLKPDNVLLCNNRTMPHGCVVKVADFGMSIKLGEGQSHVSGIRRGTPLYMAPELIHHSRASQAGDVYAFGVMLWELWHGCAASSLPEAPPNNDGLPQGLVWAPWEAVAQAGPSCWPCPSNLAQAVPLAMRQEVYTRFAALSTACLAPDPAERPTFQDVVIELCTLVMAMETPAGTVGAGEGGDTSGGVAAPAASVLQQSMAGCHANAAASSAGTNSAAANGSNSAQAALGAAALAMPALTPATTSTSNPVSGARWSTMGLLDIANVLGWCSGSVVLDPSAILGPGSGGVPARGGQQGCR